MQWPVLSKLNARNKYNIWSIRWDADQGLLISTSGQQGGKFRENLKAVIVNSSGRSLEEQAKLEGHNLWRKKLQESFQIFDPDNPEETICSPEVQDLVEKTINDRANLSHDVLDFKPMLAVEYD